MTSPPESTLASVKPTDGQTLGESGRPASRLLPVVDRHSLTHSLTPRCHSCSAFLSSQCPVREDGPQGVLPRVRTNLLPIAKWRRMNVAGQTLQKRMEAA
ncbi:hypothetical protein PC119_g10146 [Phytophthora cactorum]|nr:hypothetical protein PC114_g10743 [Phytophthora cactorum]KAG3019866.1 hypothetical protein PC119_g10146 [Phytophthora cactorum]